MYLLLPSPLSLPRPRRAAAPSNTIMQSHRPSPTLRFQVRSRTFSEEVGGEGLTLMVPFADLANHSFGHNSNFMMGADRRRWAGRAEAGWLCAGRGMQRYCMLLARGRCCQDAAGWLRIAAA